MGRSPCRCVLPECRGVTTRPPEPENRPPINLSGSGQWAALERLRGSEFHRARRQSPFVAGARQSSVWRVEGQTRILEPADDLPTASEVERWLTDLGTKSTAALRALPRFMRDFRVALALAMEEITDGTFHIGSP